MASMVVSIDNDCAVDAVREEDRVPLAVVTGASRGFGLEVTRALSESSWDVVTISRTGSVELDRLGSVIQVQGDVVHMDMADLLLAVGDRPVDLLVNNAGVGGEARSLETISPPELEHAFGVNVVGPARVSTALLPHLAQAEHALVVNVSSRMASLSRQASGEYQHLPSSYAYRIAKAAQNMLSICMANEMGPSLRVWAVHPGRLRTTMGMADADTDPADAAQRLVTLVQEDKDTQLAYIALDEGRLPW